MHWAGILNKLLGMTGELVQGWLWFALWRDRGDRGVALNLWPAQSRCAGSCCTWCVLQTGSSCSCHHPSSTVSDGAGKKHHLKWNLIKHIERIRFEIRLQFLVISCPSFYSTALTTLNNKKIWSFFFRSILHIITAVSVADSILAHRHQAQLWTTSLPCSKGRNNPTYRSSV